MEKPYIIIKQASSSQSQPATAATMTAEGSDSNSDSSQEGAANVRLQAKEKQKQYKRSRASGLCPMPADYKPTEHDVICAKGNNAKNHAGNKVLRALIVSHLQEYKVLESRTDRAFIVSTIINQIRMSGGVFVRRTKTGWADVGPRNSREKIGATFRDLLHEMYASSAKSKAARRRREMYGSDKPIYTEKTTDQDKTPCIESKFKGGHLMQAASCMPVTESIAKPNRATSGPPTSFLLPRQNNAIQMPERRPSGQTIQERQILQRRASKGGVHHPNVGGRPPQMGGHPPHMGGPHPHMGGHPPHMGAPHPQMGGPHPHMGGPPPQMGGPQMGPHHQQMGGPPMGGPHPQMGPHGGNNVPGGQLSDHHRAQMGARMRAQVQIDAKMRAQTEARIRVETEARIRAETEARIRAETESRIRAETEARIRAEVEADLRAQAAANLSSLAAAAATMEDTTDPPAPESPSLLEIIAARIDRDRARESEGENAATAADEPEGHYQGPGIYRRDEPRDDRDDP